MTEWSGRVLDKADDGNWTEGDTDFWTEPTNDLVVGQWGEYGAANAYLRFQNVTVPQGAHITVATVGLTAYGATTAQTVNWRISAVDADNALAPTTYSAAENATRTTAHVDWSAIEAWSADTLYHTPDLATVIQEVVDRPGWVSGNSIVVYLEDNSSTAGNVYRSPYSRDLADEENRAILEITYTEPHEWSARVATQGDDGCWTEGDQDLITGVGSLVVGCWYPYDSANTFLRFVNVTVPQGAIVNTATLTLRARFDNATETVNARLCAVDADNAAAPTTYAEAEGATRTTAYVDWLDIPAWGALTSQEAPDISAVVQEVVDRAGWQSGNALVIYLEDNGSSTGVKTVREACSYFLGDTENYPLLEITYSVMGSEALVEDDLALTETIRVDKGLSLSDAVATADDQPVFKTSSDALSLGDASLRNVDSVLSDSLGLTESLALDKSLVLAESLTEYDGTSQVYGDLTTPRTHPHTSKWHLAIKVPRIIWQGTVLTTRGERGVAAEEDQIIEVGSLTAIPPFDALEYSLPQMFEYLEDATLWVGSADSDTTRTDHGKCRYRWNAWAGETLQFTVSADLSCFWQAGDTVCLVDLWELWPKPHVVESDEEEE
jgi:hypothetical protein